MISRKNFQLILRSASAFTLVELLIVIAILAILAAAVVIIINPAEMVAEARDTERISGIKSVKDSIDLFIIDNPSASLGTAQVVSISIPDASSSACLNVTGLPSLPAGWSYRCVTAANLRNTNGTGWIPLDFSTIKGGSPIPYLPIDPTNDTSSSKYYSYISGGSSYELAALMESEKQAKAAAKDGGTDSGRIETGTDMSLWRTASGLVGYWPFSGTGTVANGSTAGLQDFSGKNNNGAAFNANGTGLSFVSGKVDNAIQLDGVDDYVNVSGGTTMIASGATNISLTAWIKKSSDGTIAHQNGPVFFSIEGGKLGSSGIAIYTSDAVWKGVSGTTTLQNGVWYHVAMVYDGTNLKNYVNGTLDSSTSRSGTLGSMPLSCLGIGRGTSGGCNGSTMGSFLNGTIDELKIYSKALSAAEIAAIYNAEK